MFILYLYYEIKTDLGNSKELTFRTIYKGFTCPDTDDQGPADTSAENIAGPFWSCRNDKNFGRDAGVTEVKQNY